MKALNTSSDVKVSRKNHLTPSVSLFHRRLDRCRPPPFVLDLKVSLKMKCACSDIYEALTKCDDGVRFGSTSRSPYNAKYIFGQVTADKNGVYQGKLQSHHMRRQYGRPSAGQRP